ncbi:SRPBCC family protein [Marinobacteraceae bacterium S3BR75-40.1]
MQTEAVSDTWGRVLRHPAGYQVRLWRDIEHPPEKVWSMLTDSQGLAQWLAPGTVEPVVGGRACIDFEKSGMPIDSTVRAAEPERLLEYSWSDGESPDRLLRWELKPANDGVELCLTLHLLLDDNIPISCAGWDMHLEMLLAALEGVSISFNKARFQEARSAFEALVAESE